MVHAVQHARSRRPIWRAGTKPRSGAGDAQILRSDGPAINRERASSSYLLWTDGQARMVVDMGGGTYRRFGQAGAK
jgi:ribonuclease BN (tRNA processing enzyme)